MSLNIPCRTADHSFDDAACGEPPDPAPRCAALQAILVANYEHLRRRLLRHLGCPDLASECLHEVWMRLGELGLAHDVQNPLAYIHRMACNLAVDRLRSLRPWQYAGKSRLRSMNWSTVRLGPNRLHRRVPMWPRWSGRWSGCRGAIARC